MPTIILAIFFIGSIGGIFFIVVRHLATISSLDPNALAHIRHDQLKGELLLVRFRRLVVAPLFSFIGRRESFFVSFGRRFHHILQQLKALEHYYEKRTLAHRRTATNTTHVAEDFDKLFAEAKEYHVKKLYDDAERKYIAAIALDPKVIPAYEGLGELYFEKKDYAAARETYAHIVKLNERSAAAHARLGAIASASGNLVEAEMDYAKALELSNDLVSSHIDLGVVHQTMGKHREALENFLKARELEPKNPRVLDLLLDTAIIVGKRSLAEEALATLTETNPENQKLEELRERVIALPEEIVQDKKVRRKK